MWAEWFIKRGFAIFPVDPNTKKAVIKEWQRFSVTPLSDQEREQYLKMVRDGYNYAVPGGQHGLVVLDFEGETDFTEELNEMCARTLLILDRIERFPSKMLAVPGQPVVDLG